MTTNRRWHSGMFGTEDWWSVWIGLAIFAASLASLARRRSRRLDGAAAAVGVDESHRASSPGASCSRRPAPATRAGIRSRRWRRRTSCSRRCSRRARGSCASTCAASSPASRCCSSSPGPPGSSATSCTSRWSTRPSTAAIVIREAALTWGLQLGEGAPYLARADRGACDRQLRASALPRRAWPKPRGPSGTSRPRLFFSASTWARRRSKRAASPSI